MPKTKPKTPKTRMNDKARQSAALALLIHATLDKAMAMARRSDDLARRVQAEMFTPDEQKLLKKIPADWLSMKNAIQGINAGGWKVALSFYDTISRADAVKKITESFSGRHYYSSVCLVGHLPVRAVAMPGRNGDYIIKDAGLASEVQQFVQDLTQSFEESRTLFSQINSTIAGFRTLEDLLEAIPDLAELAPDLKAQAIPPENALVPVAEQLMCSIAKIRGEDRDGCCDGKRVADTQDNAAAQAA